MSLLHTTLVASHLAKTQTSTMTWRCKSGSIVSQEQCHILGVISFVWWSLSSGHHTKSVHSSISGQLVCFGYSPPSYGLRFPSRVDHLPFNSSSIIFIPRSFRSPALIANAVKWLMLSRPVEKHITKKVPSPFSYLEWWLLSHGH